MDDYPKRDSHFAHKAARLLFKSCATQAIGHHAALLVLHIVHTEDAARYKGPVTFWNSQLMETLGFTSPKQLNTARKVAVDSGWLRYERDGTRAVGNYYVTIPDSVTGFDDRPIEESRRIHSPGGTNNGKNNGSILSPLGTNHGTNPGTNPGTNCGTNCGKLPIPSPDPDPFPEIHINTAAPPIDEMELARKHVSTWTLPFCASAQFRELLAMWMRSRKLRHGSYLAESEWQPTVMLYPTWTGEQWDKALIASAAGSTKHIGKHANKTPRNGKSHEPPKCAPLPPVGTITGWKPAEKGLKFEILDPAYEAAIAAGSTKEEAMEIGRAAWKKYLDEHPEAR